MEVLYPRCAGLDVHKDTVVACVRIAVRRPRVTRSAHVCDDHDSGLLELGRLADCARLSRTWRWRPPACTGSRSGTCSKAASSWCWPTPQHIKNVPGRKTDVNDAMWIADLLAHGLIRASFVPPPPIQELRDLTAHAQAARARDRRQHASASRRCWRTPTSSSAAC